MTGRLNIPTILGCDAATITAPMVMVMPIATVCYEPPASVRQARVAIFEPNLVQRQAQPVPP